jgi:hypothetical protein
MANITVIPGQTAAVATQQMVDASSYVTIMVIAFGLATTETATIFISAGGVWVPLADRAGVAVVLTATAPQVALEGGVLYGVTKSATAGDAGVDAVLQHFSFG